MKKIIETLKKKWIRDTSKTILLVALLVVVYVGINVVVKKLDLPDIDVTQNKLFTLTEASKQKIKELEKEVKVYVIGAMQDSALVDLVKQYQKENEKISYELVEDITNRADLSTKYEVSTDTVLIIEVGNNGKVLSNYDLYTYDYTTYQQIDVSEQKLTNAIVDLTLENKPVIYFLTGHGEYAIANEVAGLVDGLENDVNTVKELDLLVDNTVPEDASALVIGTPTKDFESLEADILIQYIKAGGKILWLNDSDFSGKTYPNIQRVLEEFGVRFDNGIILEQDSSKMVLQTANFIVPEVGYTEATYNIATDGGVMLINAGKITMEEEDKLAELGVEVENILTTSAKSLFRTEVTNSSETKISSDIEGSFVLGAKLTKTLADEKSSVLYVIANNVFVSDAPIRVGNSNTAAVNFYNNQDFVLNLLADLSNREDSITIRKDTGIVTYTATKQQDTIIKIIIFSVPVLIIVAGIIVWQMRRRKA